MIKTWTSKAAVIFTLGIASMGMAFSVSAADKVSDSKNEVPLAVTAQGQLPVTASTFTCIRDMTKVRGFYVDNLKGNLRAR